jgi:hypothetical protein
MNLHALTVELLRLLLFGMRKDEFAALPRHWFDQRWEL